MRKGIELIDDDLLALQPKMAVKFFRDLIWALAPNADIQALAHVNLNIYNPDGGIDAEADNDFEIQVEEAKEPAGLIPTGRTGYQIKTNSQFPSECKNELLKDDGELKDYIEEVVSDGGNYAYVTFSQQTPNKRMRRVKKIEEALQESGYPDANVYFYTVSQLVKYANQFPGLVFQYGAVEACGIGVDSWSKRRTIATPENFIMTEEREDQIKKIRSLLNKEGDKFKNISGCPVCRVRGASGLGKTMLVFESINQEQFSSRIIFAMADHFEGSETAALLETDDGREAILVIDNCSREQHRIFANRFEAYSRLALITISNDLGSVSADLSIDVGKLQKDALTELLLEEFSDLPGYTVDRFSKVADGYPEMAILLAENYGNKQSILDVSDSTIFNRLLVGEESDAPVLRDVKRVLTPFAFFNRIHWGASDSNDSEKKWVAEEFGLSNDFSENEMNDIIAYETNRGILKQNGVISLGTIPLATFLMESAIENNSAPLDSIVHGDCPPRLKRAFGERIAYANTNETMMKWSSENLFKTNWFNERGFRHGIGPIFRGLAQITPGDALEVLETFLGQKDRKDLLEIKDRRQLLESLRRIAVWHDHFFGAADILRKLAEAENDDRYINNATGIFADLFISQTGPYSPTEVPPMERFPILQEMIGSQDPIKHRVALEASKPVLNLGGLRGGGVPHRQGAKPAPNFWTPQDSNSRIEYLRAVWKLIEENIDKFNTANFEKAVDVLVGSSRTLARNQELSKDIRRTFRNLIERNDVDASEIIDATGAIVNYDVGDYPEEMAIVWKDFYDEITNRDLHTRLKRYVGGRAFTRHQETPDEEREREIQILVREILADPSIISGEVAWLLEVPSQSAVDFGKELARQDENYDLVNWFINGLSNADQNAACAILGGYLEESAESCQSGPDDIFRRLETDEKLTKFLPFLLRRAEPSDQAAFEILRLVKTGAVSITKISQIESIARTDELSEDCFLEISEFLLEDGSSTASSVYINLAYDFYSREHAPPIREEMTTKALSHSQMLSEKGVSSSLDQWFEWEEVTKMLLNQNIERGFEISNIIFQILRGDGGSLRSTNIIEVVFRPLFETVPERAWNQVSEEFDSYRIYHRFAPWLAGEGIFSEHPAILNVPKHALWDWVDGNPSGRAIKLARCLPSMKHDGWWDLTSEFLGRYSDYEGVPEEMDALESGGKYSDRLFQDYIEELEELRKESSNRAARRWLTIQIRRLNRFLDR